MIAVLLLSLPLGWLAHCIDDANVQRRSVSTLNRSRVYVSYNSSESLGYDDRFDSSVQQGTLSKKLDSWLGFRLFGRVIAVHADYLGHPSLEKARLASILETIGNLPQLQLVNLDHSMVSDEDLRHLRSLGQIRTLYLWGTQIGDAGVENLVGLVEMRRLGLQHTQITDSGVERLRSLRNLDTLTIAETRVSDRCVQALTSLQKLTYLDVSYTQISERGIGQLTRELPHTKIIRTEHPSIEATRELTATAQKP